MVHLLHGTDLFTLELKPDLMILGFTLMASLLTGLFFGVVPALKTSKVELVPALKGGERGTISRSHLAFGRTMVVAQVALSLILLVAAGLLLGSLRNLKAVDLGFSGEGILTFRIDPTLNGYEDQRLAALYDRLLERLDALPGVDSASLTLFSPISGRGFWRDVQLPEGGTLPAYYTVTDSRFLDTLRIPLVFGRRLSPRDDLGAPKVALVNETFARTAFDGENPIGRRFQFVGQSAGDGFEIVGVFRDGKSVTLSRDVQATVYLPYR